MQTLGGRKLEPTLNVPDTQGESKIKWTSLPVMLGVGGAIANPLLSLMDSKSGNTGLQRLREKEVDEALVQNLGNREGLLNQSPEAARIAKANQLQMGKSNAINAAASMGLSNASNAGLGGDMNSALIQAIQQAVPVMQASQGYDQALANTFTEREQQQANLNQQIGQNTMDRGVLADMTAYHDIGDNQFKYANILDMLAGGQGIGRTMSDILVGDSKLKAKAGKTQMSLNDYNKIRNT